MDNSMSNGGIDTQDPEFKKFAWVRIIAALILAVAVLWAITWLTETLNFSRQAASSASQSTAPSHERETSAAVPEKTKEPVETGKSEASHYKTEPAADSHQSGDTHAAPSAPGHEGSQTKGVHFVDALIEPINYEVNERFWGWRPNDLLNFTDNVNEMQLGTLEVTRRVAVALTEKISRAGSASSINPHLENAMNAFMIDANSYWMPSAEAKYNDAIDELKIYRQQLIRNQASFYTRSDSLIPLLQTLEELLGSCDENLVKQTEDNGEPVSTFRADNYFFYAKGVANAMATILHAVDEEFAGLLETRGARDIMHHAIESAHHGAELDPWLMVTEASHNGILANHRANMAAHISHARYYLGVLVKTLST